MLAELVVEGLRGPFVVCEPVVEQVIPRIGIAEPVETRLLETPEAILETIREQGYVVDYHDNNHQMLPAPIFGNAVTKYMELVKDAILDREHWKNPTIIFMVPGISNVRQVWVKAALVFVHGVSETENTLLTDPPRNVIISTGYQCW